MKGEIFTAEENKTMNMDLDSMPLAMAYVPMQKFQKLLPLDDALDQGSLFEELVLPFYGRIEVPNG